MNAPAMSSGVVALVLCGALLHASWNAMVKSRTDTFLVTAMVAGSAGAWSALCLPFLPAPSAASWPFIAISTVVQLSYYALLIAAYRGADMSHAYPLMRGSAPLLVATVSAPLLHEALRPMQWLAVACICGGILGLYLVQRRMAAQAKVKPGGRATAFALATACMIATFTLIDGLGVRRSASPVAYTCWVFMLTGVGILAWAAVSRRGQLWPYLRANRAVAVAGGAANLGSYSIALYAMTRAPVAAVAALRETSILFAVAIAALVLREKVSPARLAAAVLVGCGAVAMRLA